MASFTLAAQCDGRLVLDGDEFSTHPHRPDSILLLLSHYALSPSGLLIFFVDGAALCLSGLLGKAHAQRLGVWSFPSGEEIS
jgi:hypothetical protein